MTGAELLVRCLEREGVRYVFGVPGEETLHVNEALARSSIQFVPVRHEQAAAFMADVWGRLTGHAGVCLATLGPGATNLATGLADANLDRAPAVAITGQLARHLLHKESHQYVDIVDVFRPFTKWNARIETGAVVAEAVRKAFKRAQEEKPGACHLELPEDVAREPAEGEPLVADRPRRPSPDRPSLARAADIINRAERPLVLAGNGVIRGHASKELTSLAERAQIPVVTTFMAKGAIAVDHPLARTTVGLASDDPARVGFTISDVGAHKLWVAKRLRAHLPNTVIISNGFAAMGIGLPGAIAAKLAQPERRVVAVTGDGGLLMNIQELETAVRLGLGFVVLIFRDDGYGVIRWKQERQFGHTAGVDFGNPDFVALARAFGCAGARVNAAKELAPALADALRATVPVLIDCPVDYRENDRLAEY